MLGIKGTKRSKSRERTKSPSRTKSPINNNIQLNHIRYSKEIEENLSEKRKSSKIKVVNDSKMQ